jgi:hypothetical protein
MLQSRRSFFGTAAAMIASAGCGAATAPNSASNHAAKPNKSRAQMTIVTAIGAKLDHPLLQRLHELDRHIRDKFKLPRYAGAGVGSVGLILNSPLENGGYWCSPRNALTFAHTGGDGDHYSLLIKDGIINESSPVVLTWPSEGTQTIVGESLHDFLCFGMHGGYFQVLSGHTDTPTVESHGLQFHPHVEEYQQQVIALLAAELKLTPWPQADRVSRFKSLQERFRALVDAADEPE